MKALLAGLALAVAVAAPASAADLSYPAPTAYAAPVPVFTWTGFYLGANAGYGWGEADFSDDTNGFLGGIQAGYNWQFAGSPLVVGIETDLQATNIESPTFSLDYFGTVRARLGWAVDQFLIYGTGGFAYGRGNYEVAGLSNKQTNTGWTIGAGGEYAFSPNWSVKAEYLYVDLGTETYDTIAGPLDIGTTANILRLGVNYKF
ncbi:outer membrane protein [Ancylobacter defluvii]|uniref:Membrane protein n=1 Tax=Ancylobacter defluvii TaxID=1282440 RepID=A0A9W6JZ45_9HYPH|nr:outer membrane protein [Ancylobacter defluvii]MBS7588158.1 porin family protein [Ancylobacter defluvii]GLK86550.1 membrane protein [Ancylobacter defluvii]